MSTREKLSFRKTAHPRTADEGQGYEQTEVSDTLNIYDNTEARTPTLIYDARGNGDGEVASTITGDHQNRITDYTSIVVENQTSDVYRGFDSYNLQDTGEVGRCIATNGGGLNEHLPVVYDAQRRHDYQQFGDICETVQARYGTGGNNVPMVRDSEVRRLTPKECERLQGYPDDWTNIGEWTDTKGKKHKPADSPRYKALGNSIALPWWAWLADRIVKQLRKDGVKNPTMGSLFDGIGGFPLVFQRAGAKPVWASEIEEFPIAVTKRRFPEDE